MIPRARRLVRFFGVVLLIGLATLAVRLVWLHVGLADTAVARMQHQSLRRQALPARRGSLTDRFGRLLALDLESQRVWALPRNVRGERPDAERAGALAAFLAPLVGAPRDDLLRRLMGERYTPLGEAVTDPDVLDEFDAERTGRLRGVDLEAGFRRRHPWRGVAGNLLGYVNHEGVGVAGLEQGLQAALAGRDGWRELRVDPLGREVADRSLEREEAVPGLDVMLALDAHVQQVVEQELLATLREQEAERAEACLLDPRTGEVLALASVPGIDLSDHADRGREGSVMGAVQAVYAPGSTFKPLMMAAALQLGLASPHEPPLDCPPVKAFGHRRIKDAHPQDHPLTLEEIIVHSSNVGMASLLTRACPEDAPHDTEAMRPVRDVLVALGLGQATGVPVPAEAAGRITPLDQWKRDYTLASVAFGQELSVSALQMATAASSLLDGWVRPPRLVLGYVDAEGRAHAAPVAELRPVFRPDVVDRVRGWMAAAVEQGSCREVRLPGLAVAGKTGTADDEAEPGQEIHSFVALVPAGEPAFTLVVVVRHPRHARYSSQSAAPAAGRILHRLLPYLGFPLADSDA